MDNLRVHVLRRYALLLPVISTVILFLGCSHWRTTIYDSHKESALTNILREMNTKGNNAKGINLALTQVENDTIGPQPIILRAQLEHRGNSIMWISCYDADRDVQGIILREVYSHLTGNISSKEERYPIFVDSIVPLPVARRRIPVDIRSEGYEYDEVGWLRFANKCLNEHRSELLKGGEKAVKSAYLGSLPLGRKPKLPPICCSLPDLNKTRVFILAYDRKGHVSDPVEISVIKRGVRQSTSSD